MAWMFALVALALAAWICATVFRRRQLRIAAAARMSGPLPRSAARSQVIVVATGELVAAHNVKTREFTAHVEELVALSMHPTETRELNVYQRPTRELSAHEASSAASGLLPRTSGVRTRREEDDTVKVSSAAGHSSMDATGEELLRMLGPSPKPDLGNIEIYYRLGLTYLASNQDTEARRCFLTVESISPGYRDTVVQLEQLPSYSPTVSGPTPMRHAVTTSDYVPATGASASSQGQRGRR